jgi:hypothetical protein
MTRTLPPANALTKAQHDGWACVWCRSPLTLGAKSAGIARGQMGAHVLDVEVYACPDCTHAPTTRNRTGQN